jgi:hypothetical protein
MNGNELIYISEWGDTKDVTESAERAFWKAVEYNCQEFRYDNIGVGAGVNGAIRKIKEELQKKADKTDRDKTALEMKIIGWSAAGKVINPLNSDCEDKPNGELFENAKAQAYWKVREQFRQTYRYITGKEYDKEQVLTFKKISSQNIFNKFLNEISQPQKDTSASGKIIINKKPKGTKSPNILESFIIARAKVENIEFLWSAV